MSLDQWVLPAAGSRGHLECKGADKARSEAELLQCAALTAANVVATALPCTAALRTAVLLPLPPLELDAELDVELRQESTSPRPSKRPRDAAAPASSSGTGDSQGAHPESAAPTSNMARSSSQPLSAAAVLEDIDLDSSEDAQANDLCPFCQKRFAIFANGRQAHLTLCSGMLDM